MTTRSFTLLLASVYPDGGFFAPCLKFSISESDMTFISFCSSFGQQLETDPRLVLDKIVSHAGQTKLRIPI